MDIPIPYKHQTFSTDFASKTPRVFDMSDAGTGKTRAHIDAFWKRRQTGGGKALVLAPKSILQPAWGNDIERFCPSARYVIANASNRKKAFLADADIYITNHDAVKFLAQNLKLLEGFDTLLIDEITAYKHSTSQRSKAARLVRNLFPFRAGLSATPNSNTILDIWHETLLLDDGLRLGTSYYRFRDSVCTPTQCGPSRDMIEWRDKPGATDAVAQLLADITIRHKFEDCIEIPPNRLRELYFQLPPNIWLLYEELKHSSILELKSGQINAIHAGSLAQKLLQLCSGAVYHGDGTYALINEARYDLVLETALERPHSLIAFNWRHQKEELLKKAKSLGASIAYIDGTINKPEDRAQIVADFQAGKYQILLTHPQTGAHGLTLTRGTATIWASPTYNAEHFIQFNKRIYRAGQTQPTETILITAKGTLEEQVYAQLTGKLSNMFGLLDLFQLETSSKSTQNIQT